ncbi:MAG: glycosyltransferase [Hydrogenophaga sp.]|uniref:glycosyltransferase n=1 Tax=Hydrogenophaga sp. TaxID=1904254 RepID=UPI0027375C2B|nr:glycosyltransferase [Hydrogenophaga sp.]MDP3348061.1 glycosyltransferase [Hydrogenophaga sp.]
MTCVQSGESRQLVRAETRAAADSPKFTIITSCSNHSRTIEDCVASVAGQSLNEVEHIIVDLQSSDDSLDRILPHQERLRILNGRAGDTRFQAWNRGIRHATGDVLGFIDGADVLANPDVLKNIARALQDPWISAAYGDVLSVDAHDVRQVRRRHHVGPHSSKKLSRGWVPPTNALFVRKSWYRRIDGFSNQMKSAAGYDASLRLFSHPFFKATYVGEPVIRQRLVAPNMPKLHEFLSRTGEELRALRAAQINGYQALAWQSLRKVGQWL